MIIIYYIKSDYQLSIMLKNIKNNPRLILNRIKWAKKFDLNKIIIFYLHRGALENTKIIYGKDIKLIGKSFIETFNSNIPYHRIIKIEYDNKKECSRNQLNISDRDLSLLMIDQKLKETSLCLICLKDFHNTPFSYHIQLILLLML